MKTYKIDKEQPNEGCIFSINGAPAAKHIKHSKQYTKNRKPYFYKMGATTLNVNDKESWGKMYFNKETGNAYHVGFKYAWILKEVQ